MWLASKAITVDHTREAHRSGQNSGEYLSSFWLSLLVRKWSTSMIIGHHVVLEDHCHTFSHACNCIDVSKMSITILLKIHDNCLSFKKVWKCFQKGLPKLFMHKVLLILSTSPRLFSVYQQMHRWGYIYQIMFSMESVEFRIYQIKIAV
jgi:hypothetical protein